LKVNLNTHSAKDTASPTLQWEERSITARMRQKFRRGVSNFRAKKIDRTQLSQSNDTLDWSSPNRLQSAIYKARKKIDNWWPPCTSRACSGIASLLGLGMAGTWAYANGALDYFTQEQKFPPAQISTANVKKSSPPKIIEYNRPTIQAHIQSTSEKIIDPSIQQQVYSEYINPSDIETIIQNNKSLNTITPILLERWQGKNTVDILSDWYSLPDNIKNHGHIENLLSRFLLAQYFAGKISQADIEGNLDTTIYPIPHFLEEKISDIKNIIQWIETTDFSAAKNIIDDDNATIFIAGQFITLSGEGKRQNFPLGMFPGGYSNERNLQEIFSSINFIPLIQKKSTVIFPKISKEISLESPSIHLPSGYLDAIKNTNLEKKEQQVAIDIFIKTPDISLPNFSLLLGLLSEIKTVPRRDIKDKNGENEIPNLKTTKYNNYAKLFSMLLNDLEQIPPDGDNEKQTNQQWNTILSTLKKAYPNRYIYPVGKSVMKVEKVQQSNTQLAESIVKGLKNNNVSIKVIEELLWALYAEESRMRLDERENGMVTMLGSFLGQINKETGSTLTPQNISQDPHKSLMVLDRWINTKYAQHLLKRIGKMDHPEARAMILFFLPSGAIEKNLSTQYAAEYRKQNPGLGSGKKFIQKILLRYTQIKDSTPGNKKIKTAALEALQKAGGKNLSQAASITQYVDSFLPGKCSIQHCSPKISSHYNPKRKHPIFRTIRAHKGTDYAAPNGTPIVATQDGVVKFKGSQGGYGKLVELSHDYGITTKYGHMSGFHPSLKAGKKVKKGDIIGYVGSTGNSTGNHVHYEFKRNGQPCNPEKIKQSACMNQKKAKKKKASKTKRIWKNVQKIFTKKKQPPANKSNTVTHQDLMNWEIN
jgi:murein DD-endopeptidase MepM/ murein hydrolase activator NlpD